jgi:hypothetical protein
VQFTLKCRLGRASLQALFGRNPSNVGCVVLLGNMGQDNITGAAVEHFRIGEEIADDAVGKVAGTAHDALFDMPRVWTDFKHVEVVIGFENQAIGIAQMMFDQFREITEIGDDGHFRSIAAKGVSDGIGSVVRNRKGANFNVANGEYVSGANVFDASQFLVGAFRKRALDFAKCKFGEKRGGTPFVADHGKAAGMIGMLVGNQDAVNAIGFVAGRFEAPKQFLAIDSSVNEETSTIRLEQRGVARASRCQYRNAKSDAILILLWLLRGAYTIYCVALPTATTVENSRKLHACRQLHL